MYYYKSKIHPVLFTGVGLSLVVTAIAGLAVCMHIQISRAIAGSALYYIFCI